MEQAAAQSPLPMAPPPRAAAADDDFVAVAPGGAGLVLRGRHFRFAGANCYYLMTRAADPATAHDASAALDDLAAAGATVVRTWSFCDGAARWSALQPRAGEFEERVFRALDAVVAGAAARGLRLLLALTNYWEDYGGMRQYAAWAREARGDGDATPPPAPEAFYGDVWCQAAYAAYVAAITSRVNTLTGVRYRDDPTIIGWAPANEPRCRLGAGAAPGALHVWAAAAAAVVKAAAPRQLVFWDAEGFFCGGTGAAAANPYDCAEHGCDFAAEAGAPAVDVACAHLYPDLWLPGTASDAERLAFALRWLDAHIDACAALGKPLALTEFGRRPAGPARAAFYGALYAHAERRMAAGAPLVGTAFWTAAARSYPDYDGFTVRLPPGSDDDDAGAAFVAHAAALAALGDAPGAR